jgi:hypothetical protein
VALKVRVMASQGPVIGGARPILVYRAEVFEEEDRFRERAWGCAHNHESMEQAFNCGMTWLNEQPEDSAAETA